MCMRDLNGTCTESEHVPCFIKHPWYASLELDTLLEVWSYKIHFRSHFLLFKMLFSSASICFNFKEQLLGTLLLEHTLYARAPLPSLGMYFGFLSPKLQRFPGDLQLGEHPAAAARPGLTPWTCLYGLSFCLCNFLSSVLTAWSQLTPVAVILPLLSEALPLFHCTQL